jgi:hypothetical protein
MRPYRKCEVIHNREDVKGVERIEFLKGICAADPDDPNKPRDYEYGLEEIEKKIRDGRLDDGSRTPHDDRKIRYSGSLIDGDCLLFYCGLTDWLEYKESYDMSEEEGLELQKLGLKLYGDRYSFHSRATGPTVMLRTLEGSIPVGVRNNPQYVDFIHGPIANYFRFKPFDNCVRLGKISSHDAMQKEIEWGAKHEVSLDPGNLVGEAELFGVSCHPKTGETDISLLQQTNVSDEHFTSGKWKSDATTPIEYKEIFLLHNREDVKQVLQEYNNILYSTRLILESLTVDDFVSTI